MQLRKHVGLYEKQLKTDDDDDDDDDLFNLQAPRFLYIGQAFRYSLQRTLFIYLINKYISLSDICLTVHH